MFIETVVKESGIFGKGCFTGEPVPVGKIVCCFTLGSEIITEDRFIQGCADGEQRILRTGTRYAGRYFTIGNEGAPYNFINHSFEPNLLSHCGLILANREIEVGEELTLDYRLLIDTTDVAAYDDAGTGRPIRGFPPKETILRTAKALISLIERTDDWRG